MLFSATLNAWVKNLAWEYTKSPFEIEIKPEIVTVEEVTQILYHVPSEEKMRLLLGILKRERPESAIIFCNTKKYTEIVAKRLRMNGYNCEFIIGDLPQVKRLKVIDDVKAGKINLLAATDVAARGLDIEGLSMVINYDLPNEAENYVHRIGRTARAGKTGKSVTLASEQDVYELPAIERYISKRIPSEIAMQDMYAEDKSAGMQIRTDYYEERPLHSGAKAVGGKRRDTVRKTEAPRKTVKQSGKPAREASGQSETQKGQDMLSLSMEERLTLYRKKYAPVQTGEGHHGKRGTNKERPRRNAKRRQPDSGGMVRVEKPAAEPLPKAPTAPAKKGIISKFMGLFRKK
jgi:ATP-dependent RNA helicase RhlB